jgi:hypothetical protein
MSVESVVPMSIIDQGFINDKVGNAEKINNAINRVYFESMLKVAFDDLSSNDDLFAGVSNYLDIYVQNMVNELSESHSFEYGQLMMNNGSNMEKDE